MGGRSGGGAGAGRGGLTGDVGNIKITMAESLVHMKDKAMYKATKEAISRYHAVLGVRQKDVKLAEMKKDVFGVHVTSGGQSDGIYLNSKHFKGEGASKKLTEGFKRQYKEGWQTKTNKPIAHVVTHELAHATWNNHLTAANAKAAAPAVQKLYSNWMKDKKKTGYGQYSKTNINEFWAEVSTKAVHGTADKYTRAVKGIIKKYKL